MRFFADANFHKQGVRLLEAFDVENDVEHLTHYFRQDTPDTEWIQAISKWDPRPVIIGGDGRILRNAVEKQVLRECGLTFVYLAPGWTNIDWPTWSWKIIKVWPEIITRLQDIRDPTIFEVKVGLKVERIGLTASF